MCCAVPDPGRRFVVVDLLEYCHVWWNPVFFFRGGPTVYLHTVLELEHTSQVQLLLLPCGSLPQALWLLIGSFCLAQCLMKD